METLKQVASNPDRKARWKAMRSIKWRLRGEHDEFVGLDGLFCAFVPESSAMIFDGRDNEDMKLAAYQMRLGKLSVEIVSCAA